MTNNQSTTVPTPGRPRVVIVGSGFAGTFTARRLEKLLPPDAADVTLVSATDHLLYSPLLPEVAAGRLDPRRISVPLRSVLHRTRVVQGAVDAVDLDGRTVAVNSAATGSRTLGWDRLVLTTGSVTRTFDTAGVTEHAFGLKTAREAQAVHDHVLRQLELADAADDPAERRARTTFLSVGAGYAGSETAAQMQHMVHLHLPRFPRLDPADVRWVLIDVAEQVLPELGPQLGEVALGVVRARGMEVRLGTSLSEVRADGVTFADGTTLATRTVMWTVGVEPPPLVAGLGLEVRRGRLVVDEQLQVREHVWAAGDSAAAVDPFDAQGRDHPPTAQHAQRQGTAVARNVAASLGHGSARPYRHRDLGLVADLGGTASVARPLGRPLTGLPAKLVTKGYHLYALPGAGNRLRVGADWLVNLVSRPLPVQLGLVDPASARLASEHPTRA